MRRANLSAVPTTSAHFFGKYDARNHYKILSSAINMSKESKT